MEIKVLGTVSPYPKGKCNCSGFLISDDDSKIMLDCGTGTSRMLDIYRDLRNLAIIISHYHPDHYADIFSLAYASYIGNKLGFLDERVKVYLPHSERYSRINGEWQTPVCIGTEAYDFISKLYPENYMKYICYSEKDILNIGKMKISFAKNPHEGKTYAIKIESSDGTVIYSSDTGYQNNKIVSLAADADILICEATYLKGQAKGNDTHLYAYEAAKIARDANVKNLYLFHTFPEIEKEKYVLEAKEIFANTNLLNEGDIITLRKER